MLTSDMAYVINDGDRQSDKFQHFVDICCQAFNILRREANLFINLFSLVSSTIQCILLSQLLLLQ